MNSDTGGEEDQTSAVEDEVVKINYSVVEDEEDQISGVEMTDTTMETMIGIITGAATMTASGVITTTTTANGAITITMVNGAIIITIRAPQETRGTYRIPSQ